MVDISDQLSDERRSPPLLPLATGGQSTGRRPRRDRLGPRSFAILGSHRWRRPCRTVRQPGTYWVIQPRTSLALSFLEVRRVREPGGLRLRAGRPRRGQRPREVPGTRPRRPVQRGGGGGGGGGGARAPFFFFFFFLFPVIVVQDWCKVRRRMIGPVSVGHIGDRVNGAAGHLGTGLDHGAVNRGAVESLGRRRRGSARVDVDHFPGVVDRNLQQRKVAGQENQVGLDRRIGSNTEALKAASDCVLLRTAKATGSWAASARARADPGTARNHLGDRRIELASLNQVDQVLEGRPTPETQTARRIGGVVIGGLRGESAITW